MSKQSVTDWKQYTVKLDYRVTYREIVYARSEAEAALMARESTPNGVNREKLIGTPHTFLEACVVRDPYGENPVEVKMLPEEVQP